MVRWLIQGGRVIDPGADLDTQADVLIEDGKIVAVGEQLDCPDAGRVIDASGLIVSPGWIDAHVHLRDPGFTHKEDLASGAAAAAAGGFVRMCCMPNTEPALDTPDRVAGIIERAASTSVHVHPIGTITVGRKLEDIAPLREMAVAGAIGFSDDGESTKSEDTMREAFQISAEINRPIMVHCEDPELIGGSLHQGMVSAEIGDPGIPAEAEERYIERDISLAEETGGWLHVLHVSTKRGADMVRSAKQRGVRVTAEVMPHHLTLTDEWVAGRQRFAGGELIRDLGRVDPNAKVNPPLRPEADALALIDHLHEGTFDFIATDHAPHAESEKQAGLERAPFGMSGLELAIPTMNELIMRGVLTWPQVIEFFTSKPAATLRLPGGTLQPEQAADITLIDPTQKWTVSAETLRTRSKNTPLLGFEMTGRAVMTIIGGRAIHDEFS